MSGTDTTSRREQRRQRHDGAQTLVKNGGPSRLRNKRQEKIVSMIDGYDSIMTLSTAMAAVFLMWLLPAFGLMVIGALGLASRGSTADGSGDTFLRALDVAQGAQSFFMFVTGVFFIYWAFRARENVRRLGKRHRIGLGTVLIKRVKALIVAFLAFVIAFFVPIPSIVIAAIVVATGCMVYISFTVHAMAYETMRMLWRTSSPPVGLENALPHAGVIWIWSWALYTVTVGFVQSPQRAPELEGLSMSTLGLLAIVQGLLCMIAVASAARLVIGVAIRQEERLSVIISHIENDDPDEVQDRTVTTDQIQSAWDDSDKFVSFNS